MKRASVAILLLLAMIGCGGSSKTTTVPSAVTNRAFVSNAYLGSSYNGLVHVIDATKDEISSGYVSAGTSPGLMEVSSDREITVVFDSSSNSVVVVTNDTEQAAGGLYLPGATESIVLKDADLGYAAVRTGSVNGASQPGAVVKLDTKSFTVLDCSAAAPRTHCISVPSARRVVLSPDGSKLLAFSENSNSVRLIDTSKFGDETSPIQIPGFDRPVWGAFSSDSSKAYILNCGPECGGSAASVQVLNFASTLSQSTAGAPVPVAAATMGLLSGNTLFVTGTPGGAMGPAAGRLTAFDVSSGTPVAISAASSIPISDGYHTHMVLASNNKLFIGSRQCTNNPESATPTGCLTIFDTSSNKAVIDTAKDTRTGGSKGFVTGMAPVTNRNMVYVVAGGEVRVYDTTTSAESSKQINITGQAVDVKMIDQ